VFNTGTDTHTPNRNERHADGCNTGGEASKHDVVEWTAVESELASTTTEVPHQKKK
jgi:hypothetical protein